MFLEISICLLCMQCYTYEWYIAYANIWKPLRITFIHVDCFYFIFLFSRFHLSFSFHSFTCLRLSLQFQTILFVVSAVVFDERKKNKQMLKTKCHSQFNWQSSNYCILITNLQLQLFLFSSIIRCYAYIHCTAHKILENLCAPIHFVLRVFNVSIGREKEKIWTILKRKTPIIKCVLLHSNPFCSEVCCIVLIKSRSIQRDVNGQKSMKVNVQAEHLHWKLRFHKPCEMEGTSCISF